MATSGGPNWLGLLQWSLAHSDGTRPTSEVQKMGDEDRKWLEAVMKDSVKDEPARLNQIMTEIVTMLDSKSCCENEERIEIMLDELRDITEQIDMAQIFVRFGGVTCLLGLLDSAELLSIDIRCLAVGAIGTLAQNNAIVQEDIFKKGVVDKLSMACLTNESLVISAKVLYALSCIVRNFPPAEVYFGAKYGHAIFQRAVACGKASLATRAVFLSNALITSDSSSEDMIAAVTPALIPGCLPFIWCADVDLREATLRLLVSLAKTTAGRALIASNNAALESALESRESSMIADPDYAEQEEHEQRLIKEFRAALSEPVCLPRIAAVGKTKAALPRQETIEKVEEEDEGEKPVMLLGP